MFVCERILRPFESSSLEWWSDNVGEGGLSVRLRRVREGVEASFALGLVSIAQSCVEGQIKEPSGFNTVLPNWPCLLEDDQEVEIVQRMNGEQFKCIIRGTVCEANEQNALRSVHRLWRNLDFSLVAGQPGYRFQPSACRADFEPACEGWQAALRPVGLCVAQ